MRRHPEGILRPAEEGKLKLAMRLLIKCRVSGQKEYRGPLAQLAEQATLNRQVGGSSPPRPTTKPTGDSPELKSRPYPLLKSPHIQANSSDNSASISLYIVKTAQVGPFRASVPLALLGPAAVGGVGERSPEMAPLRLLQYAAEVWP